MRPQRWVLPPALEPARHSCCTLRQVVPLVPARSFTSSSSDTPPPPSITAPFDHPLSSQRPSQPTPPIELLRFFDCDRSFEVDTGRLFDTTTFARCIHALLTRLTYPQPTAPRDKTSQDQLPVPVPLDSASHETTILVLLKFSPGSFWQTGGLGLRGT
ncbi:hypothetical protein FJTKL_14054 [Diaporthe vaccinii]|uniref:Uncharacterized protein n=1 Tax=Diaporthe vaccinii TaxID=105482 RepID=A0ABR4E8Z0_9PEZI